MYQIQREIEPNSVPCGWETMAALTSPEEVTGWLTEPHRQGCNSAVYCNRRLRVLTPTGEEWSGCEWLYAHVA